MPTLEQFRRSLPRSLQLGKEIPGVTVQRRGEFAQPLPQAKGRRGGNTLATHLSRGTSEVLVGMDVTLTNKQAMGSTEVDETPRKFTVSKFPCEGGRSVAVGVKEGDTDKTYAMKLSALSAAPTTQNHVARNLMGHEVLTQVNAPMLQAACSTKPSEAREAWGLAMTSSIRIVQGVSSVMECSSRYLLGGVNAAVFWDKTRTFHPLKPVGSRIYKRRKETATGGLAPEACKFQQSRPETREFVGTGRWLIFHGRLRRSYARMGQPSGRLTGVIVGFAEGLAVAANEGAPGDLRSVVDEKSYMWSLRLCLYRSFPDVKLPYGLNGTASPATTFKALAERKVNPSTSRGDYTRRRATEVARFTF